MKQQQKHPTDRLRTASVKWACDELDLDRRDTAESNKHLRQRTVAAFFEMLKADGFYMQTGKAEAVELVLGKPAAEVSEFGKHLSQQGFQKLDEVVEWFAAELGVKPGPELLDELKGRLSNLNLQGCSDDVRNYAQQIWQTGLSVDRQVIESEAAVLELQQALFHISTVRPTQRRLVRSQWVKTLRTEFSVDDLAAAKTTIQRTAVIPDEKFHRPFLFMLTRAASDLDQLQLPPPVDSRLFTTGVQQKYRDSAATSTGFDRFIKYSFLLILVLFGTGFVFNANSTASKPSNKIKLDFSQKTTDRIVNRDEDEVKDRIDQTFPELVGNDGPPDSDRMPPSRLQPDTQIQWGLNPPWKPLPEHNLDTPRNLNTSLPDLSPGSGQ